LPHADELIGPILKLLVQLSQVIDGDEVGGGGCRLGQSRARPFAPAHPISVMQESLCLLFPVSSSCQHALFCLQDTSRLQENVSFGDLVHFARQLGQAAAAAHVASARAHYLRCAARAMEQLVHYDDVERDATTLVGWERLSD
jgi:hypothetical protein